MGRLTDAEMVAEYLISLGCKEQGSERMGGVVYRVFTKGQPEITYIAPSCKIRHGETLEGSKLAEVRQAKALIGQARAYCTPVVTDEDSADTSEGIPNVHHAIDTA